MVKVLDMQVYISSEDFHGPFIDFPAASHLQNHGPNVFHQLPTELIYFLFSIILFGNTKI